MELREKLDCHVNFTKWGVRLVNLSLKAKQPAILSNVCVG